MGPTIRLARSVVTISLFSLFSLSSSALAAPPATPSRYQEMEQAFFQTAKEFEVPVTLLEAIGFVESRWYQEPRKNKALVESDIDRPKSYGVMGLRDDDWFGHSLRTAASLIGRSPSTLKYSALENIRGAAAFLRSLKSQDPTAAKQYPQAANDPRMWINEVKKYSGIPQEKEANLYAQDVFEVVREGYDRNGLFIAPTDMDLSMTVHPGSSRNYQDAEWDPSDNFTPRAIQPAYIVIHDTESTFASAVSWLKNPKANASAHFVIRSKDGYIKQLVQETDRAWHARCWNPYTIGIEHEGYVDRPEFFTETMYKSSAKLVKFLTHTFTIPIDDMHIFGHDFWTTPRFQQSPLYSLGNCNTHTDPGKDWDWNSYLNLINAED